MNRAEAYKAAAEGKKVRHPVWDSDCYMTLNSNGSIRFYENGCAMNIGVYMKHDDGYEIIEEKKEVGLPVKLTREFIESLERSENVVLATSYNQLIDYLQNQREENESK